jgi:hypothetical protein
MHRLIKTEKVPLTRDLAESFSQLPTFKGDRERDNAAGIARILWLEERLRAGKFHTPKWATVQFAGTIYRMNGGHSSTMLAKFDGQFPRNLEAIIDRFVCETTEDIADLFDQFDPRLSTRTSVERINAHKAVYAELDTVSPTDIHRIISGIAFWMGQDGEIPRVLEEGRIRLIHDNQHYLLWASQYSGKRALGNVGIQAAMYATHRRNQDHATLFWDHVKEEDAPDNRDPTRTLATFLRDAIGKKQFGSAAPLWTPRAFFVKSIHAWNAWKTGQTTSLKYRPDCGWPKVL